MSSWCAQGQLYFVYFRFFLYVLFEQPKFYYGRWEDDYGGGTGKDSRGISS
jgi:hypothetical protein